MQKYSIEKHHIPQTRSESKVEWFVCLSEFRDGEWHEIDVERVFPTHQDAVTYLVRKSILEQTPSNVIRIY